MKYKGTGSQVSFSARRAAYDTPRSNDGALLTANDTLNTPIQVFDFQHLDVQFLPEWNDINFTLRHYADRSFLRTPQFVKTARDAAPSGSLFSLAFDSRSVGLQAGGMVKRILKGKKLSKLVSPDVVSLVVNSQIADRLGLHIPAEVLEKAAHIYPERRGGSH